MGSIHLYSARSFLVMVSALSFTLRNILLVHDYGALERERRKQKESSGKGLK